MLLRRSAAALASRALPPLTGRGALADTTAAAASIRLLAGRGGGAPIFAHFSPAASVSLRGYAGTVRSEGID